MHYRKVREFESPRGHNYVSPKKTMRITLLFAAALLVGLGSMLTRDVCKGLTWVYAPYDADQHCLITTADGIVPIGTSDRCRTSCEALFHDGDSQTAYRRQMTTTNAATVVKCTSSTGWSETRLTYAVSGPCQHDWEYPGCDLSGSTTFDTSGSWKVISDKLCCVGSTVPKVTAPVGGPRVSC